MNLIGVAGSTAVSLAARFFASVLCVIVRFTSELSSLYILNILQTSELSFRF